METAFFIAAKFVQAVLSVVSLSMMVRMIMPIFIDVDGNRFYTLTAIVTEPFIAPVRMLLAKLNVGQNSPIDWGFFAAYIIIWLLQNLLPAI